MPWRRKHTGMPVSAAAFKTTPDLLNELYLERKADMAAAPVAELMELSRANGPMHHAPPELAAAIMNSLAEATMDYMPRNRPTTAR